VYNHWRLRKYTAIAAANKAALKQEMQHSHSVRRGRFADAPGAEVPFGVRAIESGIEVDGVWVSRSNTPASSLAGSPKLRPKDLAKDRMSVTSDITRIEIPQPIHRYSETDRPSNSPYMSHEGAGPSRRKHNPPPTSDHQPRGRVSYEPRRSSQLRFSSYSSSEDAEALATVGDRSVVSDKDGKRPGGKDDLPLSTMRDADIASKDTDQRPHPNSPHHHPLHLLADTMTLAARPVLVHSQRTGS